MPNTKHLSDIVYLYDGSINGLYTCIYNSVYSKTIPADIIPEKLAQPSLLDQISIETDIEKAKKVRNSIPKKINQNALNLVEDVFLSCLAQKELAILRFLNKGYKIGKQIMNMIGDYDVNRLLKAQKHLYGEAHLLKGFVRFADYNGALVATITPKNFILPYLSTHFTNRFSEENFMIFDKTNKAALLYQNKACKIIEIEDIEFPEENEDELKYQKLWKNFYDSIAIKARENPRCRMGHMPKRYWENMLEVKDLL